MRSQASETIHDWTDIFSAKQRIAIPDPRISGAGQYAYLALVYYAQQCVGQDPLSVASALRHVQFLPYAATRSTEVFLRDRQYDALLTWESEAHRCIRSATSLDIAVIYPSDSIKIEPVVAIAETFVDQRGTREAAKGYLNFFFSPAGQKILTRAGFRPHHGSSEDIELPQVNRTHTVEDLFGTWQNAYDQHLGPTGSFARVLEYRKARQGGTQ